MSIHENLNQYKEGKKSGDKSFCLYFSAFFLVLFAHRLFQEKAFSLFALGYLLFFAFFLLVALIKPQFVHPLNHLWTKLGISLSRVTLPLVMGLLYFIPITFMALIFKIIRRDSLKLKRDKHMQSYWEVGKENSLNLNSFKNQF